MRGVIQSHHWYIAPSTRRESVRTAAVLITVLCASPGLAALDDDIAWVCQEYPARIRGLFDALNLDHPSFTPIKTAVARDDWAAACEALLAYYDSSGNAHWLRDPASPRAVPAAAEAILNDTFTFYDITATVPRTEEGRLEWTFTGPTQDREWALALNRHSHLEILLSAYLASKDAKYVNAYDASMRDWILSNPYPGQPNVTLPWRGLEAHFRVRAWARGFYALLHDPGLRPATRLLMLSSIPDHAHYLRAFHKSDGNWITMEMNGLATAAACWPEFREAGAWMAYAVEQFSREIDTQIYPDGVQHELTSHYHHVTLVNFDRFAKLAQHVGLTLPPQYRHAVESMWDYLAYTLRPDGYGLLNNDSDRDHTAPLVRAKAVEYKRPDWRYIVSHGTEGSAPEGTPSRFFPWAGQAIMRSGWDADAHWAFFDVGPLGSGHVHFDKLHLSIMAGGRDLLVDSGRYTYVGGPWRKYFVGSAGHNVVLIDGKGQQPFPSMAGGPLEGHFISTPEADVAWGTFESGYEGIEDDVRHTRTVAYLRHRYWIVVDRVEAKQPHTVHALWHFHPACGVKVDGIRVGSHDADETNLAIVPSDGRAWEVSLARGQVEPDIQGWWSPKYNEKQPATTAIYKTALSSSAVWAWLIVAHRDAAPPMDLRLEDSGDTRAVMVVTEGDARTRLEVSWSPQLSFTLTSGAP